MNEWMSRALFSTQNEKLLRGERQILDEVRHAAQQQRIDPVKRIQRQVKEWVKVLTNHI